MARDSERDVREEIKIALFWRALIGDFEYIKFNPDDLLRWYDALQLRGHEEIRVLMNERYATRPVSAVLGIVSAAPHPPTWLVREWLAFYEQKVRTGSYWLGAIAFFGMSGIAFPLLYGCTTLKPLNPYVMNPPLTGPAPYASQLAAQGAFAPPAMSPTAPFIPGQTSPQSNGIAGAAMGITSPTGMTGASNVGASAGTTSTAAGSASSQP